ncbi:glycosyltransferase [Candidatus Roizmanbacteria bacterium]|nr:glycosyltransferase [Candidatus Roizmanbacteria bacterium]
MDKIKITICIPTYNRADYLDQTLQSVANQTIRPFEVLIIDNASTDWTAKIVKKYDKYRFTYIRNKTNIGMARNYNKCLRTAGGDYCSILPSDDVIAPTWYEEWSKLIQQVKAPIYTSPMAVISETNEILYLCTIFPTSRLVTQPRVLREFCRCLTPGVPPNAATLYHRNVYRKVNLFDPAEGSETDVRVVMDMFRNYDVYFYNKYLYAFRHHLARSFDKVKELKNNDSDLKKITNYFRIIGDIYRADFHSSRESRFFIQTHIFMTLATVNLYLVRFQIRKVVRTYLVMHQYFPDLFSYQKDWHQFFRIQLFFLKRALFWKRISKNSRASLEWISSTAPI